MEQEQTAEEKDKRKNKIILLILWIIILTVTLIGTTFGYFGFVKKTGPQIITTGDSSGGNKDNDGSGTGDNGNGGSGNNNGNNNGNNGGQNGGSSNNSTGSSGSGGSGGTGGGTGGITPGGDSGGGSEGEGGGEEKPPTPPPETLNMTITVEGVAHGDNIKPTSWDKNSMANNEKNEDIVVIPFRVFSDSRKNGEYRINMSTYIKENTLLEGGSAQDIKYRVYKGNREVSTGSFHAGDFDVQIVDGIIKENENLNDEYKLYVYIDETFKPQNRLQAISFSIILIGYANQT